MLLYTYIVGLVKGLGIASV